MFKYDRLSAAYCYLAAFLGACFIASVFAIAPVKSFAKMVPFVIGATIFYKLTTNNWDDARLITLLKLLVAGIFIMSLIGNIQYISMLSKGISGLSLRVTSITTHPNALAKYVLPFIPIVVTLAIISPGTRDKFMYSVAAVSLVAVQLFTISRGAWIGMAVSALLLTVLFRSWKVISVVAGLGAISAVLMPSHIGRERLLSIFSLTHQWNIERINVWNASYSMIKDYSLFGVGLNNFQFHYLTYKPVQGVEIFQHAHNTFINIAVETGILGLIFFSLFTFTAIYKLFLISTPDSKANYLRRSIGIGLVSLLTFGLVEYNFNNEGQIVLFFILLATGLKMEGASNSAKENFNAV